MQFADYRHSRQFAVHNIFHHSYPRTQYTIRHLPDSTKCAVFFLPFPVKKMHEKKGNYISPLFAKSSKVFSYLLPASCEMCWQFF